MYTINMLFLISCVRIVHYTRYFELNFRNTLSFLMRCRECNPVTEAPQDALCVVIAFCVICTCAANAIQLTNPAKHLHTIVSEVFHDYTTIPSRS